MPLFTDADRAALARAAETRRAARAFVDRLHEALPKLLTIVGGARVSKVRDDADKVGVFAFIPPVGNVWCGIPFEGPDALTFRFEARAELLGKSHFQLETQGLKLDGAHYVGVAPLVGLEGDEKELLRGILGALNSWVVSCRAVAHVPEETPS